MRWQRSSTPCGPRSWCARQYGFTVEFALIDDEHNEFTWAVSHDGDFAAAEKSYYESPERAALPVNPADHIAVIHLAMVQVEKL